MREKLTTVIIGFGKIASGYDKKMARYFEFQNHAEIIKNHPFFELSAIVDIDEKKLKKVEQKWKVPLVLNSIKKLKNQTFDVAVISTGPEDRYNIVKSLSVKKAILFEKPVSNSVVESKKISNFCKKNKILAQVNLFRRADKTKLFERKQLKKKIGNIQSVFVIYGGGIRNNGIHIIDFLRKILGEVKTVQSFTNLSSKSKVFNKHDFNLEFLLTFDCGLSVFFKSIDFNFYRDIYIDFWGENGRVEIFQEGLLYKLSKIRNHRAIEGYRELNLDDSRVRSSKLGRSYYDIYENMKDAIFNNQKLISDIENAIKSEKIIEAIVYSASNNKKKVNV